MKKMSYMMILVLVLGMFGCNTNGKDEPQQKEEVLQGGNSEKEIIQHAEQQQEQIVIQKGNFLVEDTEENLISIQLPEDYKDDQETEQFIEDFILNKISSITTQDFKPIQTNEMDIDFDKEYSNYRIQMESEIKLKSDTLVSIVFYGMINKWDTAHPNHVFFSLNFHPDTFEIVKFQDKYEMSEESYLIFLGALEEKMSELCGEKWPVQREWFIEDYFTKEIFMRELKTEKYSCAYYTDTTVGISVDVPFVLCDHIEFEISYEEVEQFAIEK